MNYENNELLLNMFLPFIDGRQSFSSPLAEYSPALLVACALALLYIVE